MASEHIEPAIKHIIGQHFKLLTEAKESNDFSKVEQACQNWWLGMLGMEVVLTMLEGFEFAKIVHMNEMRSVAYVIHKEIGYCPLMAKPKRRGWDIKFH